MHTSFPRGGKGCYQYWRTVLSSEEQFTAKNNISQMELSSFSPSLSPSTQSSWDLQVPHVYQTLKSIFFNLLSQNPDWHHTASFKSLCLTAQSALSRLRIPPVILVLLTWNLKEFKKETEKKKYLKQNKSFMLHLQSHSLF